MLIYWLCVENAETGVLWSSRSQVEYLEHNSSIQDSGNIIEKGYKDKKSLRVKSCCVRVSSECDRDAVTMSDQLRLVACTRTPQDHCSQHFSMDRGRLTMDTPTHTWEVSGSSQLLRETVEPKEPKKNYDYA